GVISTSGPSGTIKAMGSAPCSIPLSFCDVRLGVGLFGGKKVMKVGSIRPMSGWKCALAMTAALLAAAPLSAQTLTRRLLEDARDGRLVNFEFFAAALIASGVEDECELAGWLDLFTERRAELLSASSEGPASERSQALHVALHETILTGAYSISASDVRLALADGNFNCLSSLAIYFDLCRAAGLKMKICLERGHVFVISTDEEGTTKSIEPGARWESRR